MGNWRILFNSTRDFKPKVGMWVETGMVYFTLENLTPDDVNGRDIEFGLTIQELEKIITQAKIYERQIAND